MSLGTQHIKEQRECPDYAFVYWVTSDITLRNMFIIIIREYGIYRLPAVIYFMSVLYILRYFCIHTQFNDYIFFDKNNWSDFMSAFFKK